MRNAGQSAGMGFKRATLVALLSGRLFSTRRRHDSRPGARLDTGGKTDLVEDRNKDCKLLRLRDVIECRPTPLAASSSPLRACNDGPT